MEALAISTGDSDWRPDELIRQDGIDVIVALLHDKKPHIVVSALDIILAIAAAGEEEALISSGVIDHLDRIQDHKDRGIQKEGAGGAMAPGPRGGRGGDIEARRGLLNGRRRGRETGHQSSGEAHSGYGAKPR